MHRAPSLFLENKDVDFFFYFKFELSSLTANPFSIHKSYPQPPPPLSHIHMGFNFDDNICKNVFQERKKR
jgi:hypothetical protein